jgi:thiol:disulfide interchange protein DsbA
MIMLKKILLALALCGVALGASAELKNGVDYKTLPTAQPTESGKKIEVTEFFAYSCPHCNAFQPSLSAWAKAQSANIVFKRIHVGNGASNLPQQRLFFTLEALGLQEQLDAKVFHAMHVDRLRLNSDELVFDFIAKQGVDRKKFTDAYNSFGVAARVRRANAMMEAYQVDSWPLIAIDGRLITSPALASSAKPARNEAELHANVLAVMDHLVKMAQTDKK